MNNELKASSSDFVALPEHDDEKSASAGGRSSNDTSDDCGSCASGVVKALEHLPDGGLLPGPPPDPEDPVLPSSPVEAMPTATRHVATVQFEISSRGPFKSFAFHAGLPEALTKHITKSEWEELRSKFDELGRKTKWNESAGILLVATTISFFAFLRFFASNNIYKAISIPILCVLAMGSCLFTFQVFTQRRKKEAAMNDIRSACKEYSQQWKKRWIHMEFYESDPKDKFSLYHAQLSFHKTVRLKEPERIPYVMDDRYYDDQD